jgi:hypothetical protein
VEAEVEIVKDLDTLEGVDLGAELDTSGWKQ